MKNYFSPEEALLNNIEKMGEELGAVYSQLWQEVTWLHKKWDEYLLLFGTSEETVELLNKTAPDFFYLVERTMWEAILLQLARLCDPAITRSKTNLSLYQFELLTDKANRPSDLTKAIKVLGEKTSFCRDLRNRVIAHSDLGVSLNRSTKDMGLVSRLMIREAIDSVDNVVNTVSKYYLGSTTMFINPSISGSARIIHILGKYTKQLRLNTKK